MSYGVQLIGLDQALQTYADMPDKVMRAAYRSINKVAAKGRTQASRDIRTRYNLTTAYVNQYLTLQNATSKRLEAVIRARQRGVQLSRYDARQLTVAAKTATGDMRRGIPPGRKQAGVSFEVVRQKGRVRVRRFFLIPLMRGTIDGGNGFGVAVRTGRGKRDYEVLHTISVDQMLRWLRPQYVGDMQAELAVVFQNQLSYELR